MTKTVITCLILTLLLVLLSMRFGMMLNRVPTNKVEEIIKEIHSAHDYQLDVYDCSNYTEDAIEKLNNLSGIKSYFVVGRNEQEGHAWVRVCRDYDVTLGLVQPETSIYDDIRVYQNKKNNTKRQLFVEKYNGVEL